MPATRIAPQPEVEGGRGCQQSAGGRISRELACSRKSQGVAAARKAPMTESEESQHSAAAGSRRESQLPAERR